MKKLLFLISLLFAVPVMAQTGYYTGFAIQPVVVSGSPQAVVQGPIGYAGVRVCSLPLTQQQPCLPLANITDQFGNSLSNSIGSNFGQLAADVTGKFTFGCSQGVNYQLQYSGASNVAQSNYPITCPGSSGTNILPLNNTFTGSNTFTAPQTFSNVGFFGTTNPANEYVSSILNNCNIGTQLGMVGASSETDALAGCANIPSNATVLQAAGIAGYTYNPGTTTNGVGMYAQTVCAVPNANCWGAGEVVDDIAGLGAWTPGLGTYIGNELDVGAQNPVANYNQAYGYTVALGGTNSNWTAGTFIAGSTAFLASGNSAMGSGATQPNRRWNYGFQSVDNRAGVAFLAGGLCNSVTGFPCNSQPFEAVAYSAGGAPQLGSIALTNTGNWIIAPVSNGGTFSAAQTSFGAIEGTAASAQSGIDLCYGDSTAHALKCSNNGGSFGIIATATLTLKKGSGSGNYTNATTSYTVADSTNLCLTAVIPTGWKLGVQASGALGTSTAIVNAFAAVTDNASCSTANSGVLAETQVDAGTIGGESSFSISWVIAGDGNTHNVALQFKTSNAADTANLLNSSATLLPTMTFTLVPSN